MRQIDSMGITSIKDANKMIRKRNQSSTIYYCNCNNPIKKLLIKSSISDNRDNFFDNVDDCLDYIRNCTDQISIIEKNSDSLKL